MAIADPSFLYCEGVAFNPIVGRVAHAWCVRNGEVVDRTPHWIEEGADYFGIEVPMEYVWEQALKNDEWNTVAAAFLSLKWSLR